MKAERTKQAQDWNLMLVATSEREPAPLLETLRNGVTTSGGWVLSQGKVSARCADIDFEFPRARCMEVYSLLVATGVELSQEAHQQLAELCHCTMQLNEGGQSAPARVYLSVYAGEGSESFLGQTMGSRTEAA